MHVFTFMGIYILYMNFHDVFFKKTTTTDTQKGWVWINEEVIKFDGLQHFYP